MNIARTIATHLHSAQMASAAMLAIGAMLLASCADEPQTSGPEPIEPPARRSADGGSERLPPERDPSFDPDRPRLTPPRPRGIMGTGAPPISRDPYEGPETAITIHEDNAALVEVDVPTGGYILRFEAADAIGDDTVRLFFTLEGPAPTEMVSQAFQKHSHRYEREAGELKRAEVYINITVRGRRQMLPNYRLAAKSPV